MKKYLASAFIKRFVEVAADSDYSRHPELQQATLRDIQAAGEALWWHTRQHGRDCDELYEKLDGQTVVDAMLKRERFYADSDELISTEYQKFWDAADAVKLSFNLREEIRSEVSAKFLGTKQEQGYIVVDNAYGIWLFKFDG